jgi:hypothetical protein
MKDFKCWHLALCVEMKGLKWWGIDASWFDRTLSGEFTIMSTSLKDYVIKNESKWCIYNFMCIVKNSSGEDKNLEC